MQQIVRQACAEARLYEDCGVHGLMIENMHDVPYLRGGVGPEIVAGMTLVAQAVRAEVSLPIGLQILAAADLQAMAVAHVAGLSFVRVECFSFAHVADEGIMQSNAAQLLRYRRQIGADAVQVWADIKKKHASHALTADLSITGFAEAAEFMGADGLIVTGTTTGRPPAVEDVTSCSLHSDIPTIVGSGVSPTNVAEFLQASQGVIVGSSLKIAGDWRNAPDPESICALVSAAS